MPPFWRTKSPQTFNDTMTKVDDNEPAQQPDRQSATQAAIWMPELMELIHPYLTGDDRKQCALVCKVWRDHMRRLYWRKLYYCRGDDDQRLLQFGRYVLDLKTFSLNIQDFAKIARLCPNIKDLDLKIKSEAKAIDFAQPLRTLSALRCLNIWLGSPLDQSILANFGHCRHLTKLGIHAEGGEVFLHRNAVFNMLKECTALSDFELSFATLYTKKLLPVWMDRTPREEDLLEQTLEDGGWKIPTLAENIREPDELYRSQKMKVLTIRNVHFDEKDDLKKLLKFFPSLESITLHGVGYRIDLNELDLSGYHTLKALYMSAFGAGAGSKKGIEQCFSLLPSNLETLRMEGLHLNDNVIQTIPYSTLENLTTLVCTKSTIFTLPIIHYLFKNCPKLKTFDVCHNRGKVANQELTLLLSSEPWVCGSTLEHLTINHHVDSYDALVLPDGCKLLMERIMGFSNLLSMGISVSEMRAYMDMFGYDNTKRDMLSEEGLAKLRESVELTPPPPTAVPHQPVVSKSLPELIISWPEPTSIAAPDKGKQVDSTEKSEGVESSRLDKDVVVSVDDKGNSITSSLPPQPEAEAPFVLYDCADHPPRPKPPKAWIDDTPTHHIPFKQRLLAFFGAPVVLRTFPPPPPKPETPLPVIVLEEQDWHYWEPLMLFPELTRLYIQESSGRGKVFCEQELDYLRKAMPKLTRLVYKGGQYPLTDGARRLLEEMVSRGEWDLQVVHTSQVKDKE